MRGLKLASDFECDFVPYVYVDGEGPRRGSKMPRAVAEELLRRLDWKEMACVWACGCMTIYDKYVETPQDT